MVDTDHDESSLGPKRRSACFWQGKRRQDGAGDRQKTRSNAGIRQLAVSFDQTAQRTTFPARDTLSKVEPYRKSAVLRIQLRIRTDGSDRTLNERAGRACSRPNRCNCARILRLV